MAINTPQARAHHVINKHFETSFLELNGTSIL